MKYNKKSLQNVDIKNKKVIVRLDLNVPMKDGVITDTTRIEAALETLNYLIKNKSKIIILSHLNRIKTLEDIKSGKKSLEIVAKELQNILPKTKILFEKNNTSPNLLKLVNDDINFPYGTILILENTRYNDINSLGELVKYESKNNQDLGKFWASLGDVFVNDAFGTSHRSHASNVGVANFSKTSCIGFLIQKELKELSRVTESPKRPFIAILGGAKISDKIKTIEKISELADNVIIGGGMAHTFLTAQGYNIGKSLSDKESFGIARKILSEFGNKIILPIDHLVTNSITNPTTVEAYLVKDNVPTDLISVDDGPESIKIYGEIIKNAKTIFWNGPLGIFEVEEFSKSTVEICKMISKRTAEHNFTIIGGGDSATAAKKLGFEKGFTFISTGGGASLSFIEGNTLPGIECINDSELK